jgi:hypothetical protein
LDVLGFHGFYSAVFFTVVVSYSNSSNSAGDVLIPTDPDAATGLAQSELFFSDFSSETASASV